ncbi:hypothetical protein P8452_77739 [Trifolium repens]|nr:hypothetical protein P8452_77739 [Trifolium repens]
MAYNHVGGDTAHGLFFAILGSILFIPGFYYTRIAYYAYKGYKGMKNQSSCFEIFLLFSLPDCDSPICFIRLGSNLRQRLCAYIQATSPVGRALVQHTPCFLTPCKKPEFYFL